MPYVNVQITKGASREQKAEIVKDITGSLERVLGKKPEYTHVVFRKLKRRTGASQANLQTIGKRAYLRVTNVL